jgi:hypothetical protein
MAAQYSHKQFFRRTPNAYLAAYFKSQGVDLGLDFTKLKESDAESILKAFETLPEERQVEIEAQFQDVNALACEGGVTALVDEASFHEDTEFIEALEKIDGFHAKVLWAFLEKPKYWHGASMFLHADNVSVSFWKKRNDIPKIAPSVEDEDIEAFAKSISQYFKGEGRGKNCKVEPYRRYQKEYFFAYPEDFAQSGVEWVSNTLKTRAHHPAFEIIFVYSQEEGFLDIYAPKNTKAVPELQRCFAKSILKLEVLEDGAIDNRVYDLEPAKQKDFEFKIEPEMGIASAVITRIKLTLKGAGKKRITLEADTRKNPKAVYNLLEDLNLPLYDVTQLGVKVTFEADKGKRAKTRAFNISYPNTCALNYDGKDSLIRKMLSQSGLEPKVVQGS